MTIGAVAGSGLATDRAVKGAKAGDVIEREAPAFGAADVVEEGHSSPANGSAVTSFKCRSWRPSDSMTR